MDESKYLWISRVMELYAKQQSILLGTSAEGDGNLVVESPSEELPTQNNSDIVLSIDTETLGGFSSDG